MSLGIIRYRWSLEDSRVAANTAHSIREVIGTLGVVDTVGEWGEGVCESLLDGLRYNDSWFVELKVLE